MLYSTESRHSRLEAAICAKLDVGYGWVVSDFVSCVEHTR